jgi:hypothetical protein
MKNPDPSAASQPDSGPHANSMADSHVENGAVLSRLGNCLNRQHPEETNVNQIIYIVGAVVIVIALLSFVGLR